MWSRRPQARVTSLLRFRLSRTVALWQCGILLLHLSHPSLSLSAVCLVLSLPCLARCDPIPIPPAATAHRSLPLFASKLSLIALLNCSQTLPNYPPDRDEAADFLTGKTNKAKGELLRCNTVRREEPKSGPPSVGRTTAGFYRTTAQPSAPDPRHPVTSSLPPICPSNPSMIQNPSHPIHPASDN
ncbi:hypothetical protein DM02DRAFT_251921 [Periconia macrospinosa]|uniref:Uncharacterized protein n=1 Tax=Periconia macrospinosa TaxID=97972 RepID=A0A2V1D4X6_9PLEO|nr:hypothetical protein DM02DRAFT_251921 [Periconia macrospinosa]